MSEITDYLSGYLNELDSYMERFNSNRLSGKDRQMFFEMSNEYYDIFQKAEDFPEELLQDMAEFSDNITNQAENSVRLTGKYYENITQRANDYIDKSLRAELQFGVFQKDAEIARLQYEKIQMLQDLTDLDLKKYGQITEQTQEILAVQNCEILNGRVREIGLWERENQVPEIMEYQEEADKTEGKGDVPMEKKRVVSKDELDQVLNNHFVESQSERGAKKLDLSNCIISNYVFKGDLSNISFERSDLRFCEFRMTKAEHINMQNATLTDCKLTQAEFNQCNFNNADINSTVIRNSMFRESSFDTASMRQSSINDSVFYRTSFADTRMRECAGSENIFHECGNPENTIRPEAAAMDQEEFEQYANSLREMFSNEGYAYSWELNSVDPENYAADLSIKISYNGEIVEEEKYSALLDPDTYAISHIDTGRQGDSLIRMFTPEMNKAITENYQEKTKEQESRPVRLRFPYMTRSTFMAAKEEIKKMGAQFNPDHKSWYVDQSVGQETIANIQDYLMSHDEAIYLHLPPADPKSFKGMIDQLKQDGARYNPDKKLWYITEKEDRNKFLPYLPTEKESVHEKLSQYKAETEKQHTENREIGAKRKETQERV